MKKSAADNGPGLNSQAILTSLSEDLSLPLVQIRSALEVLKTDGQIQAAPAEQIELSLDNGLQLIEAYKLALKVNQDFDSVVFEPVAIGAVLDSVAHDLWQYAGQYDAKIEVSVTHRLKPALAHIPSLRMTIQLLGASIIRAQAAQSKSAKKILLGAQAQPNNLISAGVYSSVHGLSDKALRGARGLAGRARQPLPAMPPGAASGILIADMLSSSLWQPLRSAAHHGLNGLAVNIPISKQLQII